MKRKEYIEVLEDGTRIKYIVNIYSTLWDDYKVGINITSLKCLPRKRTWIANTDLTEEKKVEYRKKYVQELLNTL